MYSRKATWPVCKVPLHFTTREGPLRTVGSLLWSASGQLLEALELTDNGTYCSTTTAALSKDTIRAEKHLRFLTVAGIMI